jgi:tripartite-type tricarboxylate transporter receptor subunit TctC
VRGAVAASLTALVSIVAGTPAPAQDSPARPVTIVLSLAPGGPADQLTRLIGEQLGKSWQQPVVVENRGGGGGNLAAAQVARAPADGYTLLSTLDSVFTVNPVIYPKLGFDPAALTPVMRVASNGLMVVANPATAAKSVGDLVARSQAQSLNYSSAGNGSPAHLATVLLARRTGLKGTHVPYRGAAPAVLAVLSGEVDFGILPVPAVMQHVATRTLIGLAVTGRERSPLAPHLPTLAEAGIPGADVSVEYGLFAPASTPKPVLDRLTKDVASEMARADVKAQLAKLDMVPDSTAGAAFARDLAATAARWTEALKGSGIQAD